MISNEKIVVTIKWTIVLEELIEELLEEYLDRLNEIGESEIICTEIIQK